MQIKELIPLISAIVHPMAVLWVPNISKSLFSYSDLKREDMIIGKVSSTLRNAYLRCDGKGFNSSLGGFCFEGNTLSSIGGNVSNLGAHPFSSSTSLCSIMECRNSNSDVVTFSTQIGLTRQDMRGSSYETLST